MRQHHEARAVRVFDAFAEPIHFVAAGLARRVYFHVHRVAGAAIRRARQNRHEAAVRRARRHAEFNALDSPATSRRRHAHGAGRLTADEYVRRNVAQPGGPQHDRFARRGGSPLHG